MNAIQAPNRRRLCSHCRMEDHDIRDCNEAFTNGTQIHRTVLEIIRSNMHELIDDIDNLIMIYLNSLVLSKVRLLLQVHNDIYRFACRLYNNRIITMRQSKMHTKMDLLIVLVYYYRPNYIPEPLTPPPSLPRKFQIHVNVSNASKDKDFQCPVCLDEINNSQCLTTNCNHDVCYGCFDAYLSSLTQYKSPSCCLCRTNITSIQCNNLESSNNLKNKHLN
jgi:hypothetical protein